MSTMSNDYVDAIGLDLYERMPKAVLAAVAVSVLTCGGDRLDEARDAMLREWQALFAAGVVPQRPPQRMLPKEPQE